MNSSTCLDILANIQECKSTYSWSLLIVVAALSTLLLTLLGLVSTWLCYNRCSKQPKYRRMRRLWTDPSYLPYQIHHGFPASPRGKVCLNKIPETRATFVEFPQRTYPAKICQPGASTQLAYKGNTKKVTIPDLRPPPSCSPSPPYHPGGYYPKNPHQLPYTGTVVPNCIDCQHFGHCCSSLHYHQGAIVDNRNHSKSKFIKGKSHKHLHSYYSHHRSLRNSHDPLYEAYVELIAREALRNRDPDKELLHGSRTSRSCGVTFPHCNSLELYERGQRKLARFIKSNKGGQSSQIPVHARNGQKKHENLSLTIQQDETKSDIHSDNGGDNENTASLQHNNLNIKLAGDQAIADGRTRNVPENRLQSPWARYGHAHMNHQVTKEKNSEEKPIPSFVHTPTSTMGTAAYSVILNSAKQSAYYKITQDLPPTKDSLETADDEVHIGSLSWDNLTPDASPVHDVINSARDLNKRLFEAPCSTVPNQPQAGTV